MNIFEEKESFTNIFITSLWVFLAWLIWSVTILIISFIIWNQTEIFSGIYNYKFWTKIEWLYTILFSFVTLIWTVISSIITYKILWWTNPKKYKKNNVIFSQIAFFQILVYIFIAPIYLLFWWASFENIMICYIFHILIIIFWVNIILDILNNYRYVLIWIYWTFIALFISILISIWIFNLFWNGMAKLISLVFLLPIINFLNIFIKKLFEVLYYHFYKITASDPIWDIFYKIKKEDEETEKEEAEKNIL